MHDSHGRGAASLERLANVAALLTVMATFYGFAVFIALSLLYASFYEPFGADASDIGLEWPGILSRSYGFVLITASLLVCVSAVLWVGLTLLRKRGLSIPFRWFVAGGLLAILIIVAAAGLIAKDSLDAHIKEGRNQTREGLPVEPIQWLGFDVLDIKIQGVYIRYEPSGKDFGERDQAFDLLGIADNTYVLYDIKYDTIVRLPTSGFSVTLRLREI
ncbi:hypothetical protein [Streptomyces sp. PTD9-10]|uniref:hypothetical protein n=1 Tax=Streptomyces sp. PTD9-10 TaxID=3120151 RepID=UPI003009FCC9